MIDYIKAIGYCIAVNKPHEACIKFNSEYYLYETSAKVWVFGKKPKVGPLRQLKS